MSSAPLANQTAAGQKKYSPVFLAVFAMFLIATTICVAGTLIGILQARLAHHDTLWFWASGHLLVSRANPYDQLAIRQIETSMGLPVGGDLPMTRNPPPSLFLMIPLGMLGPRAGAVGWSLLLAVCFVLSVLALRGKLAGPYEPGYMLLAWFLAPALCCIEVGQMGLIPLLGLALFLRFCESLPFWAGTALSLCTVKPHLFLPFGVALFAWILTRRRWSILWGAIVALTVESMIVMLFDPAVWTHYHMAMRAQRIVDEFVPTFGVGLRFLVYRTAMWLEFVPAALGSLWALWYFWRNRKAWNWQTHGSLVMLVSLVAAPYAWFTDQVVALPAIIFALTRPDGPRKGSVTLLLALMSAAAVDMMVSKSLFFKPDMALSAAWLLWYLYATSSTATAAELAVAGQEQGK
jgi:hypothetical protein